MRTGGGAQSYESREVRLRQDSETNGVEVEIRIVE